LLDNLPVIHDQGMDAGQHQKIGHPSKFRTFNGDAAVIRARDQGREKWIEAAVAGDNAYFIIGRTEGVREAIGVRADLSTYWAKNPINERHLSENIDQNGSLVGRCQHHYPPQIQRAIVFQIVPQYNSAQGVSHEIDFCLLIELEFTDLFSDVFR